MHYTSHMPEEETADTRPLKRRKLLTPEQVGEIYGVDAKTVGRWADQGRLKHFRTPGGHRRFYEDDITEAINSAYVNTVGEPTDKRFL